jgi:serine O-acetyltransferase
MSGPLFVHRIAHALWRRRIRIVPGLMSRLNFLVFGCDIPPSVKFGKRVHLQHCGSGVIMFCNVEIGDDVWINPQTVIGQNIRPDGPTYAVPMSIKIGNRVVIGAGAKIITSGVLVIGDGAAIGANAVVLNSIPPNCVAVGVPAKVSPRRK